MYPGKYLPIIDAEEMAKHALEGMDKDFPKKIKKGDIIVTGRNFGCGSSREQAATCLKFAGISCVIAKSFSRIFFRNAINQGLALVQSSDLLENVKEGDEITIDFSSNQIVTKNKSFPFPALDAFVMGILEDGGLIEHTKKILRKSK
ncbi:MAG TPA: 3-isopropylmalate dehydratase [candidate division Zixibacteria bacterium]